jgi:hypothetical protein
VDPLADEYSHISAYCYVGNDPLNAIDPTGMAIENLTDRVRFTGSDATTLFNSLTQNDVSGVHFVFEQFTPDIYTHTNNSFKSGHPTVLTYDDDPVARKERRRQAIMGIPTKPGYDRYEYPDASTEEGGTGASVALVPRTQNRLQGGQLSLLYSQIEDGDTFLVLPVPKADTDRPKVPAPVPVEAKERNSRTRSMRPQPSFMEKWMRSLWPRAIIL